MAKEKITPKIVIEETSFKRLQIAASNIPFGAAAMQGPPKTIDDITEYLERLTEEIAAHVTKHREMEKKLEQFEQAIRGVQFLLNPANSVVD